MNNAPNLRDILQQLSLPFSGELVFDCLPDTVFFIKDTRGRYLSVNQTLVQRCGLLDKDDYEHVAAAVSYAEDHIADAPTVDDLSAVASMSPYRLDKRLADSNLSIAAVALKSGYADQSAFTRQFRLTTGMSPSAFRRASNRHGQLPGG